MSIAVNLKKPVVIVIDRGALKGHHLLGFSPDDAAAAASQLEAEAMN